MLEIAAIALINVLNLGLKRLVRRARPQGARFASSLPFDYYSFPSGHAATAMANAASLGSFIGSDALFPVGWARFVGAARFFGELHYAIDIITGLAVGALGGTVFRRLLIQVTG